MPTQPIQAIIFDFDLTLADSSEAIVECTQYALTRLDCPSATPERIRSVIGLSLPVMFRSLSGDADPERASAFVRYFVERADVIMVQSTRIYPQVPGLLADLRNEGLALAIVSTKFRHRIDAILTVAGLRSQVDVLVGGEDVKRHKPDPEGIVQALGQLGIPAAQAIYVGDHAVDAQAAAQAGTGFIGMVSGTTSFDAWTQAGKKAVKRHVGEVVDLVRAMRLV
ncbi:HAD family hydrolase [Pandoraea bronchicola]|uniref:phosphoglycolate phosphatase n=1 Tax=Pandoraea bronchicola TaxID=2508287 RepID=A0A5E5BMA7_9BURK|nr:HAD family hydrolase [Pandoraea bronchicola]VVE86252.1 Phosphoglycolate phosphatase [Pandoraea bronchicola]